MTHCHICNHKLIVIRLQSTSHNFPLEIEHILKISLQTPSWRGKENQRYLNVDIQLNDENVDLYDPTFHCLISVSAYSTLYLAIMFHHFFMRNGFSPSINPFFMSLICHSLHHISLNFNHGLSDVSFSGIMLSTTVLNIEL